MTSDPKFYLERIGKEKAGLYYLLRFEKVEKLLHPFLGCLMRTGDEESILSLTITSDEISLIVNKRLYQDIFEGEDQGILSCSGPYIVLRVDTTDPGLFEHGILAKITQLFSQRSIPVFCLSTCTTNYIFVPAEKEEEVQTVVVDNL